MLLLFREGREVDCEVEYQVAPACLRPWHARTCYGDLRGVRTRPEEKGLSIDPSDCLMCTQECLFECQVHNRMQVVVDAREPVVGFLRDLQRGAASVQHTLSHTRRYDISDLPHKMCPAREHLLQGQLHVVFLGRNCRTSCGR